MLQAKLPLECLVNNTIGLFDYCFTRGEDNSVLFMNKSSKVDHAFDSIQVGKSMSIEYRMMIEIIQFILIQFNFWRK